MKVSYRLVASPQGWIAECVEADAEGQGETAEAAVFELRQALAARLRPEAVAPPPSPLPAPDIELVRVD
jgi:hypothetical protein